MVLFTSAEAMKESKTTQFVMRALYMVAIPAGSVELTVFEKLMRDTESGGPLRLAK